MRPSNIIGGGDWSTDRLIPDCVRALSAGKPISIRNPGYIRPWQYFFNPLFGYLLLGSCLLEDAAFYSGGFNLGAPEKDLWTVETVVKKIIQIWGSGSFKIEFSGKKPYEAKSVFMNCEKAKSILNWHPLFDLSHGLKETISWYRKYYNCNSKKEIIHYSTSIINSAMEQINKSIESNDMNLLNTAL